jgi:osomolarity two-component system sensor histidine kinase SLN1
MRVGIREQLAAIVLLGVLVTLCIVTIPVWISVNGFIADVKSQALALTASLKAAQVASVLDQLQVISNSMCTRLILQQALNDANGGNKTSAHWPDAVSDLQPRSCDSC